MKNASTFMVVGVIVVVLLLAGLVFYRSGSAPAAPAEQGSQQNATTSTEKTVTYKCADGKSITATFHLPSDTHVDLVLSDGRTTSVSHAISASGARYANTDESFVFWNKGDTAFIIENGTTTYQGCALPGTSAVYNGWKTATDSNTGIVFQYPPNLPTTYIIPVDWPPKVQVETGTSTCVAAGDVTARAGKTEERSINGHSYCVTEESEGAAGSVYNQYAYAFREEGETVTLTFSLRFVQCMNYDDPKQSQCEAEREIFDIGNIIDNIAQSVTVP
jgi:membrane-bound inhibitor of C-type lysozyme